MVGYRISPWLKYCWKYVTPAVTASIFIFFAITYKALKYNKTYEYPSWAIGLGWCLALSSMIALPIGLVYQWLTTPGETWREVRFLLFCLDCKTMDLDRKSSHKISLLSYHVCHRNGRCPLDSLHRKHPRPGPRVRRGTIWRSTATWMVWPSIPMKHREPRTKPKINPYSRNLGCVNFFKGKNSRLGPHRSRFVILSTSCAQKRWKI